MNSFFGLNWLSYFVTGALVLVASSLMSGCVFGNNEIDQTVPWDGVTGYYDTTSSAITFCATFTGQSQPTCAAGTLAQVSSAITSTMVDPVALKLLDSSGDTAFYDPTTGDEMDLVVNPSTLAISFSPSDVPVTNQAWWQDTTCNETDAESATGQLTRYAGGTHTAGGETTTGRVVVTFQSSSSFNTGCANALTLMTNCYENVADCGATGSSAQEENGELQQSLANLFTTLVNPAVDLGLVSLTTGSGAPANSIANLVDISMTVSYQ